MTGLIIFCGVCLAIGVALRMATGQSAGEAVKNTVTAAAAPTKFLAEVTLAGVKAATKK